MRTVSVVFPLFCSTPVDTNIFIKILAFLQNFVGKPEGKSPVLNSTLIVFFGGKGRKKEITEKP
jgi:hypothetical protein